MSNRRRQFVLGVVGLGVLAAFIAVVVAEVVYPHGTADLDEVSYQTQANALRAGHLDLPARNRDPFFLPFLTGVRDNRVVFKYQPVWPALIAGSDSLFGSSIPLRALFAALGVLVVAWLAWELTKEELVALLAAALALASPFTWLQGASLLGYQLSFVLGTGAAAALLRFARVRKPSAGLIAGAIIGLAVLHRPFDAVLAVPPVLIYLAWETRRERSRPRMLVPVVIGALPFAVVFFAYNAAVMGSPLRLAYSVTSSHDSFFFGWRASNVPPGTGHADMIHYTLGHAWSTLLHDLWLFPRFLAIAPIALGFAGLAVWKRRRDPRCWLLVAIVACVVVSYFFWWATANAELFGIDRALGPFYDYAALAPLCVLAAWGLASVRVSRRMLVGLGAVAIIWAPIASTVVLSAAGEQGRARSNAVRESEPASRKPTLVVVPGMYLGDPYIRLATNADLSDRHLSALDVSGRRLELVARYPDRAAWLVRDLHRFGDPFGARVRTRVPLKVIHGTALTLQLSADPAGADAASAYLRIGNGPPVITHGSRGRLRASWRITPATMRGADMLTVGVTIGVSGASAPSVVTKRWYECRFEVHAVRNELEVLTPCDGWNQYQFPNGRTVLSHEDVSHALAVSIRADL